MEKNNSEELSAIREILDNIDVSLLDIAESLRILSKRPSLEEELEDDDEDSEEDEE